MLTNEVLAVTGRFIAAFESNKDTSPDILPWNPLCLWNPV